MKKPIPTRTDGWKFAGRAGDFNIWHAGKNDYRITDGAQGEVVDQRQQFGLAHARARHLDDARKSEAITSFYADRNASGLAALAR